MPGSSDLPLMRVLGVDPGTAATGYGVVEAVAGSYRLIECGVVRPRGSRDLAGRLEQIYVELRAVIERLEPTCLAVEGVFHSKNSRTVVVLAHARGVALLAGARCGLTVAEYAPAEIKKAVVGTGRASKDQVGYMVQKLLHLAEQPRPADAADGCAAALCHLIVSRPLLAGAARR
ncbi:MAG: crossover junction endodeoxyribonuclease RuvC [Gemmatimonadota bacterium]